MMRPKKRYLLARYSGRDDAVQLIKSRYTERFGGSELAAASLKLISYNAGLLVLRCNLAQYRHLLEVMTSADGSFVTLDMSGTLRALRSRQARRVIK